MTSRATAREEERSIAIDLLVPENVSPGRGRRAARLAGHDPRVARKVRGLEGALVDADTMAVGALEPADHRVFDVRIAGPAALLVAKIHKIADRAGSDRVSDKDALDVLRLLKGSSLAELARRYRGLLVDERSGSAATDALARRSGAGVEMAVRSAGVLVDPAEIRAACVLLAGELLEALGHRPSREDREGPTPGKP